MLFKFVITGSGDGSFASERTHFINTGERAAEGEYAIKNVIKLSSVPAFPTE